MAKNTRKPAAPVAPVAPAQVAPAQVAPVAPVHPMLAIASAVVNAAKVAVNGQAAKPRVIRYAPTSMVSPQARIVSVQSANPKQPGTDTHARWARFMRAGVTVEELGAQYKAANLPANWATLDVRWALQRNHIALEAPTAATEEAAS